MAKAVAMNLGLQQAPLLLVASQHTPCPCGASLLHVPYTGDDPSSIQRLADGTVGWRRRAMLVLPPIPVLSALTAGEQLAMLAMALAPMCLPGGGGWSPSFPDKQCHATPAAADVVTVANLLRLVPDIIHARLSAGVRAKLDQVHTAVTRAEARIVSAGDRAALLLAGHDAHTAIHKICLLNDSCQVPGTATVTPSAQELLQQVRR